MKPWLLITLGVYLAILVWLVVRARREGEPDDPDDFAFASGRVDWKLSTFGIAATLFSTFTLLGMPDFVRQHGIGAWIFLGVTDVSLAGILLWAGGLLRSRIRAICPPKTRCITSFLASQALPRGSVWLYVIGASFFLLPYMTIQVKGAAILLEAVLPLPGGALGWSLLIVLLMVVYSAIGGMRAVFNTDAIQGVLLLVVVWAIAVVGVAQSGGIQALFASVAEQQPALLSTPGPAGLLGTQFLTVSFISICMMPYVQPQLATRVLIVRSDRDFAKTVMGLGVFAMLVIIPTIAIGLLVVGQPGAIGVALVAFLEADIFPLVGALFIVGVLAAAMSTIDSQLLAIGTEWSAAMHEGRVPRATIKVFGAVFAVFVVVLAQTSFQSIVLFSVNSFIGTSLLFPLILSAAYKGKAARMMTGVSFGAVLIFGLKVLGVVPPQLVGLRTELWIYIFLVVACTLTFIRGAEQPPAFGRPGAGAELG